MPFLFTQRVAKAAPEKQDRNDLLAERTNIMIIILKKQAEEAKINALKKEMTDQGLGIHESEGINTRILGLVGDTSVVDMRHIMANSIVENVQRIQEPYKKANRKFHPNDTVVDVNGVKDRWWKLPGDRRSMFY